MNNTLQNISPEERMKGYLLKIATGPNMSKNLTEQEAQDGLSLVLENKVSAVRSGLFLISLRMKRETLEENIGFWRALDSSTHKQSIELDNLLQIADAFDGFQRIPYFGFYTLPVLAEMGLPVYGHSSLPLPPKFGITFEDLLVNYYGVPTDTSFEQRKILIQRNGFGYLSTQQSHPKLDSLQDLRKEIVKRPMLATFEKMLIPLKAKNNFLATNYFHPGYEEPMLAAAKLSDFNTVIIGNGMEGTTLYGIHKKAKLFIHSKERETGEEILHFESMYDETTLGKIQTAFEELKEVSTSRENVAELGERALKDSSGPAAVMIAHQAATLKTQFQNTIDFQRAFNLAIQLQKSGKCLQKLMSCIKEM